jgi:arabinofuranosyltransferase
MPGVTVHLGEALVEIVSAYARELQLCFFLFLLWLGLFRGLASSRARQLYAGLSKAARVALLATGITVALFWAWHLLSLFDDAFISLRYAQNLVRGRGLVFNVGERVEGYTNFLWTLLLAAAMALHLDGPRMALFGCLACFALELLLLARLSRRLNEGHRTIPFAAILFGASYTCASFGTSGMETMFSALLLTLMLDRALAGRIGQAGSCGVLAILTHPDAAILFVGLGASLAAERRPFRALLLYAAPFLLVYLPYLAWRWHYYGDLVPNTFYAKSASLPYYSQGLVYLTASLVASGAWALLPLVAVAIRQRPRALLSLFLAFGVVPYLFYVVRIGGDFMLGRLLVPVLPALFLIAELGMRDLVQQAGVPTWPVFVLPAIAVLPVHLVGGLERRWNLSDERTWYRVTAIAPQVRWESDDRTQALLDLVARGQHPVVAEIPVGREAFMTDLTIVDVVGLTDREVARQPLSARGLPGHEKLASADYLRSRNVALSIVPMFGAAHAEETHVRVRSQWFYLGRYEPRLVEALRSIPDSFVPDLPGIIDAYLSAPPADPRRLARDIAFFESFYFPDNGDTGRHQRLRALLAR